MVVMKLTACTGHYAPSPTGVCACEAPHHSVLVLGQFMTMFVIVEVVKKLNACTCHLCFMLIVLSENYPKVQSCCLPSWLAILHSI